jgi:hypothetical protein
MDHISQKEENEKQVLGHLIHHPVGMAD